VDHIRHLSAMSRGRCHRSQAAVYYALSYTDFVKYHRCIIVNQMSFYRGNRLVCTLYGDSFDRGNVKAKFTHDIN